MSGGANMDTLTYTGSCEAISDGHTTRIDLSANWSGRIECTGQIVVVTRGRRDRAWLASLFERMRKALREEG
jgi:hypothetical protein